MAHIGIIGGSGLYALEGLKGLKEIHVDTPYGPLGRNRSRATG